MSCEVAGGPSSMSPGSAIRGACTTSHPGYQVACAAAIGSALRSLKATTPKTHHHYTGPVRQETNTITAPAYGLIASNRNNLSR
ncbi:hypothetical protein ABZ922_03750 [Streptomyces shenzhenensis]|uniref:hypothetical protein n=1 Tax=Streptomyces shenzhenensis TaxID=943815 RepID=UPI00340F181F